MRRKEDSVLRQENATRITSRIQKGGLQVAWGIVPRIDDKEKGVNGSMFRKIAVILAAVATFVFAAALPVSADTAYRYWSDGSG